MERIGQLVAKGRGALDPAGLLKVPYEEDVRRVVIGYAKAARAKGLPVTPEVLKRVAKDVGQGRRLAARPRSQAGFNEMLDLAAGRKVQRAQVPFGNLEGAKVSASLTARDLTSYMAKHSEHFPSGKSPSVYADPTDTLLASRFTPTDNTVKLGLFPVPTYRSFEDMAAVGLHELGHSMDLLRAPSKQAWVLRSLRLNEDKKSAVRRFTSQTQAREARAWLNSHKLFEEAGLDPRYLSKLVIPANNPKKPPYNFPRLFKEFEKWREAALRAKGPIAVGGTAVGAAGLTAAQQEGGPWL